MANNPVVILVGPADGETIKGVVPVTFYSLVGQTVSLQFIVDGVDVKGMLEEGKHGGYGPFKWNTRNWPNGYHTYSIRNTDYNGVSIVAAPFAVLIDN